MSVKDADMWLQALVGVLLMCQVGEVLASSDYEYGYSEDDYSNRDYPRDWSQDWAAMVGRIQRPKCIDIPQNLTLCQKIGYDRMRLPNLLDHDTLSEVTQQAKSWVPLLGIHCHPDTKLFLCSLFSPVCLDRAIFPCRSLCESVKESCLGRMKVYGFDWPEMLRCDKFPVDNDLCIKQQNHIKPDNNCTACKHPMTYEAIVDSYCRADFVIRAAVQEIRPHLEHSAVIMKRKRKFFKKNNVTKKERKKLTPLIESGAHCECDIAQTKGRFLIMGNKKGHEFMMSFIIPWQKKQKAFRQALKALRKGNLCAHLFKELSAGELEKPVKEPTKPKKVKGKNKKKKNKKKKKKNRKNKKRKNRKNKKKKGGKTGEKGKDANRGKRKPRRRGDRKKKTTVTSTTPP